MKKAKWAILAISVLSLVALYFWARYVVGLRSAGEVGVLQSNHMLEAGLVVWCVVFIALVLAYSRLSRGDRPRKVPKTPRELAARIAKTVCMWAIGTAIALLLGAVLFGTENYPPLNTIAVFAVSCAVNVGLDLGEYRRRWK